MPKPEATKFSDAIALDARATSGPLTRSRPGRPKRPVTSDIPEVVALLTWLQGLLDGPPRIRYADLMVVLGFETRSSVGRLLNGDRSAPPSQSQIDGILRHAATCRERRDINAQTELVKHWQRTAQPLCRAANAAVERRRTLLRKSAQQLVDELEYERQKAACLQQRLDTLERIICTVPGRALESSVPKQRVDDERDALVTELDRARRREADMRADLERARSRTQELERELAGLRIRFRAISPNAEVGALTIARIKDQHSEWLVEFPPLRADLPDAERELLTRLRALLQGARVTAETLSRNLCIPCDDIAATLTGENRMSWADVERFTAVAAVVDLSDLDSLYRLCEDTQMVSKSVIRDRVIADRDQEIEALKYKVEQLLTSPAYQSFRRYQVLKPASLDEDSRTFEQEVVDSDAHLFSPHGSAR